MYKKLVHIVIACLCSLYIWPYFINIFTVWRCDMPGNSCQVCAFERKPPHSTSISWTLVTPEIWTIFGFGKHRPPCDHHLKRGPTSLVITLYPFYAKSFDWLADVHKYFVSIKLFSYELAQMSWIKLKIIARFSSVFFSSARPDLLDVVV